MRRLTSIIAVCVLAFSVTAKSEEEPERVLLKRVETKRQYFVSPVGIGTYTKSEEKDLVPGNDSFGFFYKPTDEKRGICRLRVKVVCDYGMEILKEQKNIDVKIQFTDIVYKGKTDLEGIMDALIRCDVHRANDGVIVTARKFMISSKLSEFPKELRIPDADCK
ncbi:hypothetical protein [Bdellovibrio sp. HCB274]|uniref:hypothetical protein n=1 Tax=Bdellovibrio sp. HCB274 TaxID=3394361 RepID=UPI0039B4A698